VFFLLYFMRWGWFNIYFEYCGGAILLF